MPHTESPRSILAVLYEDGMACDAFIAGLGYRLRAEGVRVAGIVQRNTFVRNRTKCDMEIEELASGAVLKISEDRGPAARGCRLDRAALAEATALLSAAIGRAPDIVLVNKFGKTEADGRGLRDALAETVERGTPLLIGVPYRNLDQWQVFAGELAESAALGSPTIDAWLAARGWGAEAEPARLAGGLAREYFDNH